MHHMKHAFVAPHVFLVSLNAAHTHCLKQQQGKNTKQDSQVKGRKQGRMGQESKQGYDIV